MNNSLMVQNITNNTNITNIQNITNSLNLTYSTNKITATSNITISPSPTFTNTNINISINLSPTGIQKVINTTNATNATSIPNTSIINSMISPIYSATPLPYSNSSRNLLSNNDNFINNVYIIGIRIGIVFLIILILLFSSYLCKKKKNIKKIDDDDKYLLPSMSYSPKNHSKIKNIFQQ